MKSNWVVSVIVGIMIIGIVSFTFANAQVETTSFEETINFATQQKMLQFYDWDKMSSILLSRSGLLNEAVTMQISLKAQNVDESVVSEFSLKPIYI